MMQPTRGWKQYMNARSRYLLPRRHWYDVVDKSSLTILAWLQFTHGENRLPYSRDKHPLHLQCT